MKKVITSLFLAALSFSTSVFATSYSTPWKVDVCGELNPKDIWGDITITLEDGTKYFVLPSSIEAKAVAKTLDPKVKYEACVQSIDDFQQGFEGLGIIAHEIQVKGTVQPKICGSIGTNMYNDVTLNSESGSCTSALTID